MNDSTSATITVDTARLPPRELPRDEGLCRSHYFGHLLLRQARVTAFVSLRGKSGISRPT